MNSDSHDALFLLRAEFQLFGDWTPAGQALIQTHGVPYTEAVSGVGRMALSRCVIEAGQFDFAPDGEQCLVFEVFGEDDVTVIDLCAFSLAEPQRFGTGAWRAFVLGEANVRNPASWTFGQLLRVHRSPLPWLQGRCQGIVIVDHRFAPVVLRDALGQLLAEDEEHARALRQMLSTPAVPSWKIVYPRTWKGRAA